MPTKTVQFGLAYQFSTVVLTRLTDGAGNTPAGTTLPLSCTQFAPGYAYAFSFEETAAPYSWDWLGTLPNGSTKSGTVRNYTVGLVIPDPVPGPQPCTLTLDAPESVPIVGASMFITTDAAGLVPFAGPYFTNSAGQATFNLIPGDDYYLWTSAAGFNPVNGRLFTAVAD